LEMGSIEEKAREFDKALNDAEKKVQEAFSESGRNLYFDDFVRVLGFSRPVVAQYIHALEKRGKITGDWEIIEEGDRRIARKAYWLQEDV